MDHFPEGELVVLVVVDGDLEDEEALIGRREKVG